MEMTFSHHTLGADINYLQAEGFLSFHFITNILTEPLCQLPIPCLFLPKIRDIKLFTLCIHFIM